MKLKIRLIVLHEIWYATYTEHVKIVISQIKIQQMFLHILDLYVKIFKTLVMHLLLNILYS